MSHAIIIMLRTLSNIYDTEYIGISMILINISFGSVWKITHGNPTAIVLAIRVPLGNGFYNVVLPGRIGTMIWMLHTYILFVFGIHCRMKAEYPFDVFVSSINLYILKTRE